MNFLADNCRSALSFLRKGMLYSDKVVVLWDLHSEFVFCKHVCEADHILPYLIEGDEGPTAEGRVVYSEKVR